MSVDERENAQSLHSESFNIVESIRRFVYGSIAAGLELEGSSLRLDASVQPGPNDQRPTKTWSQTIDISHFASQLASPPASAAGDQTENAVIPRSETLSSTNPGQFHIGIAPDDELSGSATLASSDHATSPNDPVPGTLGVGKRKGVILTASASVAKKRKRASSDKCSTRTQLMHDGGHGGSGPSSARQLENSDNNVPQRKQFKEGQPKMQPSTLDKLIAGIWDNLYKKNDKTKLDVSKVISILHEATQPDQRQEACPLPVSLLSRFQDVNELCSRVTKASSYVRGLELIIQAFWIDCFDARVRNLVQEHPEISPVQHKKATLLGACRAFGWTEKDLRNRMAVWKGYCELKEAAGWSALIFSGSGIYRFCKYRVAFDANSLARLGRLRWRFEVAADTMYPDWRRMLSVISVQSRTLYFGHPLDWVVSRTADPVPLSMTYRQWDLNFKFEHLEDCVLDRSAWGDHDPRQAQEVGPFMCQDCNSIQSQDPAKNQCPCFEELFGPNRQSPRPVQVFATEDGRNNGLLACCDFPRGSPIGEFVGVLTRNLHAVDVMTSTVRNSYLISNPPMSLPTDSNSQTSSESGDSPGNHQNPDGTQSLTYQIFQGRQGNYTRFVNHSCLPNAQYQKFTWLGHERTVLVSKGIGAGTEITADYSDRYWDGLDKRCLCRKPCCRYR